MSNKENNFEVDELIILDTSELEFSLDSSGFITLNYRGETYKKVNLTRLIPLSSKDKYISVSYNNADGDFKEIGIIDDINDFNEQQFTVVNNYLEFKYYMPQIQKILKISVDGSGILGVVMLTTAGKKTVSIRDWYTNFKLLNLKILYVVDIYGNKYICEDVKTLDTKSRALVELYA